MLSARLSSCDVAIESDVLEASPYATHWSVSGIPREHSEAHERVHYRYGFAVQ